MKKNTIVNLLIIFISTSFGLLALETAYRIVRGPYRIYRNDSELGWAPKENVKITRNLFSSNGRVYKSTYQTNELGIRNIYDINKNLSTKKVLIIGDSFTGDFYSSNEDSWFNTLQKELDPLLKVYAYGIGGSGTSQQFIAFKRLQKEINAEILLIQHCYNDPDNDFFKLNNYWNRNQDLRRPYYDSGKFYFRQDLYSKIYTFIYNNSFLIQKFDPHITDFQQKFDKSKLQKNRLKVREKALIHWANVYTDYVNYAKSKGIKEVWSVSCMATNIKPQHDASKKWLSISRKLGIKVFESFSNEPLIAEKNGVDVRFMDRTHFNDQGNKLAGKALAKEILFYLREK